MRTLIIIILTLLVTKCNQRNITSLPEFSFKDSSYLRFHVKNCAKPASFTLFYNKIVPFNQVTMNLYFAKDTIDVVKLTIDHPVAVNFFTSDSYASCYALPKDTMDIWIDMDSTKKFRDNIVFKGKTAAISDYLTRAKINTSSAPYFSESVNEYNKRADSLANKGLLALNDFNKKEPLPLWFFKMEEVDIKYLGVYEKVSQFTKRYLFYNQYVARPEDFIEKLHVKIDNPDAKYCEAYYDLLCSIFTNKYDTLLTPQNVTFDIFYSFVKENINSSQKYLHSEIRDIFIAQRVGSVLSVKRIEDAMSTKNNLYFLKVDSLFTYAKTILKDTVLINILFTYQKNQYGKVAESQSLKPGLPAPDFKLTDLTGKTISLSDFKGRIVFINFWATWCAPCIRSIPDKNRLFNTYKNRGVAFINVCLDSDDQKWRSLIKENGFLGVHLTCKGNWSNIVDKSYYINAIPHYTLIDRNGIIIKNRVESLSELEDLIKRHI